MELANELNNLPDAVFIIEPATARIIDVNVQACRDMHACRENLLGKTVIQLQDDVHDPAHWHSLVEVMRRERSYLFIGHHRRLDGTRYPVEVHTAFIEHEGRELLCSVARDISTRVEIMNRFADCECEEWQGLHDIADGVWEWNLKANTLYFSPALKRMLGYGPDEMEPRLETWKDNIHPEDAPLVLSILDEHLKGLRHLYEAEYRLRNRNGHYVWIRDRGQVRERDESGTPLRAVGLVNNITDLKLIEQDLQQQADYDVLTGLLNRRRGELLAEEKLALMHRQGCQLGVCLIDIDDFKQINDIYGHLAGDQALKRVAGFIRDFVRRSDLLFRWGGEEFVLICPDTDKEGMRELLSKLCRAIECMRLDGDMREHTVTISAGVSVYPDHSADLLNLIARADSALYTAKQQGKNRVVLHEHEVEGPACSVSRVG